MQAYAAAVWALRPGSEHIGRDPCSVAMLMPWMTTVISLMRTHPCSQACSSQRACSMKPTQQLTRTASSAQKLHRYHLHCGLSLSLHTAATWLHFVMLLIFLACSSNACSAMALHACQETVFVHCCANQRESESICPERSTTAMLQEAIGPSLETPTVSAPSKYVQQLFQGGELATHKSSVQQELLQLKAQITDAAATLELERQAYQRARVRS